MSIPYSLSPLPSPAVSHVSEEVCVSDRRTPPASQHRGKGGREGGREGGERVRKRRREGENRGGESK